MKPKEKNLSRILATTILKIVDDLLWNSAVVDRKEIPNLNPVDRTIVMTECSIGMLNSGDFVFQSVRETYAFGIMNTYTIAYNVEANDLVGLMSANKVTTYKTQGLISKYKIYKLAGPVDAVQILDIHESNPSGLMETLSIIVDSAVVKADQDLSPRFVELISRCKQMHLKESDNNECSTVIDSN